MDNAHELPAPLIDLLRSLNTFTGNIGDAALVDWKEQTVSIVGQVGSNPDNIDTESAEVMLEVLDGNVRGLLDKEHDGEVIEKRITDGGFCYVIDISAYNLPIENKQTRVPFNRSA